MGLGGGKGEVGSKPSADQKSGGSSPRQSSSATSVSNTGNIRSAYETSSSSPRQSSSSSSSPSSVSRTGNIRSAYDSSPSPSGGGSGSAYGAGRSPVGGSSNVAATRANSVFSPAGAAQASIQSRVQQGFDAVNQQEIKDRVNSGFDTLSRYENDSASRATPKSAASPAFTPPSPGSLSRAVRGDPMAAASPAAAIAAPGSLAAGRAADRETMPGYSTAPAARAPLSATERDAMIRTVYGEAGNQDNLGKSAVTSAILNRVDSPQFPNSVSKVVKQKDQFEPWNTPAGRERMANIPKAEYDRIGRIVDETVSGVLPDVTGGAEYFANEKVVRDRNGGGVPGWMSSMADTAVDIGDHTFLGGDKTQSPFSTAYAGANGGATQLASSVPTPISDPRKAGGGLMAAASVPTPQPNPVRQMASVLPQADPRKAAMAATTPVADPRRSKTQRPVMAETAEDPFAGLGGGLALNASGLASDKASAYRDEKPTSFAAKYLSDQSAVSSRVENAFAATDEAEQAKIASRVNASYGDVLGGVAPAGLQAGVDAKAADRRGQTMTPSDPVQPSTQSAPAYTSPPRQVASLPVAQQGGGLAPAFTSPPREVSTLKVAEASKEDPAKAPALNWNRAALGATLGSAFGGIPGAMAGGIIGATSEYLVEGLSTGGGSFASKYLGSSDAAARFDPANGQSDSMDIRGGTKKKAKTEKPASASGESSSSVFTPTQTTGGIKPSERFARTYYEGI